MIMMLYFPFTPDPSEAVGAGLALSLGTVRQPLHETDPGGCGGNPFRDILLPELCATAI